MKKRVKCVETEIIYETAREAAEATGASFARISSCLRNPNKKSGNYHWEIVDDCLLDMSPEARLGRFKEKFNVIKNNNDTLKEVIILGPIKNDTIRCDCSIHHKNNWFPRMANLLNGHGCKECGKEITKKKRAVTAVKNNNLLKKYPELCKEWDYSSNEFPPEHYSASSGDYVEWICPIGHQYQASIRSRVAGTGCTVCNKINHSSFPEQAIMFYLEKCGIEAINTYKEGFGKSELDIYIPSLKIGIEYDGRQGHTKSTIAKEKKKYIRCQELGIKLIRIRENLDGTDKCKICDLLIESLYNSKYKEEYNLTLKDLFQSLSLSPDIDILRDENAIKEKYYVDLKNKSLKTKYPKIADEWNYELNKPLRPEMFYPHSNLKVWWNCPKGHEPYQAWIGDRVDGHGCQQCGGVTRYTTESFKTKMAIINPNIDILGEYPKNGKEPIMCYCKIHKLPFPSTPNSLLDGHGCNKCAQLIRDAKKKKKVVCVTTNKEYESITEAVKQTGASRSSITRSLKDGRSINNLL